MSLENFVHPKVIDEGSLEVTMLDNIAHELLKLNDTMSKICEALQAIALQAIASK